MTQKDEKSLERSSFDKEGDRRAAELQEELKHRLNALLEDPRTPESFKRVFNEE